MIRYKGTKYIITEYSIQEWNARTAKVIIREVIAKSAELRRRKRKLLQLKREAQKEQSKKKNIQK